VRGDTGLAMIRFIFFTILFFILYYLLLYLLKGILPRKKRTNPESEPEELVQDPNCQTYIPKRSALKKKISGNSLYFCSQECLKNYLKKQS
jgi:YHS domain-containing protein